MGLVGLVVLLVSWMTLLAAPHVISPRWVPGVWMAAMVALPSVVVLGIVAGRRSSKWWYLMASLGLLSFGFMVASVAV